MGNELFPTKGQRSWNSFVCPCCHGKVQLVLAPSSPAGVDNNELDACLEFIFSPDFRTVSCKHGQFRFSKSQAAVIRVMYENYRKKIVELHISEILNHAGLDPSEDKLEKIFRHRGKKHPAWGTLFSRTVGKNGFYQINF